MLGESYQEDKADETKVSRDSSRVLGEYRLVRELGQGGMGTVYEATHEATGQKVALKLMSKRLVQGEAHRKRFDREMIVATMLDHPGITSLLDFGEHEGEPYYVMEYVEGWPLDTVPQEILLKLGEQGSVNLIADMPHLTLPGGGGPRNEGLQQPAKPPPEGISGGGKTELVFGRSHFSLIAGLALQAADALHYAHERGVIHRDIKPSNLMLTPEGKVKILDFGLAKAVDLETLTTTGDFFGTPAYMSPEQAAGEVSQIDHRSDVYSLGVTLYQLLTGRAPFTGETRVVASAILNKQPVEPRKLDRRIPGPLNAVVSKAIEKKREDRYQSAKELADDLRRYLSGSKVKARQGSLRWRLTRTLAKRKKEAILVTSSLFVAVAAFVVFVAYPRWKGLRYERLMDAAAAAADSGRVSRAIDYLEKARRLKNTVESNLRLWKARETWKRLLPDSGLQRADALAVSPNGGIIAAGYGDGSVKLWETDSKRRMPAPTPKHRGGITAVSFSHDENLLASADLNGDVLVWDIANRETVDFSEGTSVAIRSLAFLPDAAHLFMADDAGHAMIYEARGELRGRGTIHEGSETFVHRGIRPNATGGVFAAVTEDKTGDAWAGAFRMASGDPLMSVRLTDRLPSAIAASESGDLLALGYPSGAIDLYREGEDSPQALQTAGQMPVRDLCFLRKNEMLLACYNSGAIVVWDIVRRSQAVLIGSACDDVAAVAVASNGKWAAVSPAKGGVQLWRTDTDQMQLAAKVLRPPHDALAEEVIKQCAVAFSARGKFVASGDGTGRITAWETGSGQAVISFNHCSSLVTAVAFSPKEEAWLAYANSAVDPKNRAIWICDVTTGKEIHRFRDQPEVVQSLAFHEDGRLLASGDRNSGVALWDVESFTRITSAQAERWNQVITDLRFATTEPDRLIAWSSDGNACFWTAPSLKAARLPFEYKTPEGIIGVCGAIGPRGYQVATISKKGNVGIWDFEKNAKAEFTPSATSQAGVRCLAFSRNGKIIASASTGDMTVRLWDVKQQREAITLSLQPEPPVCLAFDPSTSRLAVGLLSGRVVLYEFSSP